MAARSRFSINLKSLGRLSPFLHGSPYFHNLKVWSGIIESKTFKFFLWSQKCSFFSRPSVVCSTNFHGHKMIVEPWPTMIEQLKKYFEEEENVTFLVPNTDGLTTLHVAAGIDAPNRKYIVTYLLKLGADPNARSHDGLTPVHIAAMWDHLDTLKELLNFDGNPWLCDYESKNAFDMASENDADECCEFLQTVRADHQRQKQNTDEGYFLVDSYSSDLFKSSETDHLEFVDTNKISTRDFDGNSEAANKNYLLSRKHITPERKCCTNQDNYNFMDGTDKLSFSGNLKLALTKSNLYNNTSNRELLLQGINEFSASLINYGIKQSFNVSILDKAFTRLSTKCEISSFCSGNMSTENEDNEQITYTDEKEGIVLVERFYPSSVYSDALDSSSSSSCSSASDWRMFHTAQSTLCTDSSSNHSHPQVAIPPELMQMENSEIFRTLKELGDNPGPVLDSTRNVYLQRLAKLKAGNISAPSLSLSQYCHEVYQFLEGKLDLIKVRLLEQMMCEEFDALSSPDNCREGTQKSSFNYFLLDPRVTRNLPLRASLLSFEEMFSLFIGSLFYVGKGTRARPYCHLYEAVKANNDPSIQPNAKLTHILDIWRSGLGVVSLHCFQNAIPVEAYTREACILEAIGLSNLTNVKKGNFYGLTSKWTISKKRQLGVLFLHHALEIFLHEGERLIRPKDIKI